MTTQAERDDEVLDGFIAHLRGSLEELGGATAGAAAATGALAEAIGPAVRGSCCDDPKPRVLERSGRMFCASCRRYLDRPAEQEEERDDGKPAGVPARDARPGRRPADGR